MNAVMLRKLSTAHLTPAAAWASPLVRRSFKGPRPGAPEFWPANTVASVRRKRAETERTLFFSGRFPSVPRSRQASKGFQSRLFAMQGWNVSVEGVKEPPTDEDYLERYKDYRGLAVLKFIGFEITKLSPTKSTGRFVTSEKSCQPFNVLHGGTTAYIAESIASVSGAVAADFQRVAGIELSCSHLRSVPIGTEVEVTCVPLRLGRRIQVWEVKFETSKPERPDKSELTASSESSDGNSSKLVLAAVARVTLLVGLPISPESKL